MSKPSRAQAICHEIRGGSVPCGNIASNSERLAPMSQDIISSESSSKMRGISTSEDSVTASRGVSSCDAPPPIDTAVIGLLSGDTKGDVRGCFDDRDLLV